MKIEFPDPQKQTLLPIVYLNGVNIGIFQKADTTEGWVEQYLIKEIREELELPTDEESERQVVRLYGKVELRAWEDLYEGMWSPTPLTPDEDLPKWSMKEWLGPCLRKS